MSPFATFFHSIRISRGVTQKDIAELAGYEQSYVSAMENGLKGPPNEEFLEKISRVLLLSTEERERLENAAKLSQRKFMLPINTPESIYVLVNELMNQINSIHPTQVEVIRAVLKIPVNQHAHQS